MLQKYISIFSIAYFCEQEIGGHSIIPLHRFFSFTAKIDTNININNHQ